MKYEEFDQHLLQGKPGKRNKVQSWKTAIGLQEVDGLVSSAYLLETAKRHIDGVALKNHKSAWRRCS